MKNLALVPISTLLLLLAACGPLPPNPEGDDSSTTDDAQTDTTDDPSTSTSDAPDTTGSEDSTSGSAPSSCGEATTREQCVETSSLFADCGWFETTVVNEPLACEGTTPAGVCLSVDALDGCDPSEAEDACADLGGGWFVRTLEGGAIELLSDPHSCGGPGEFEPCPWFEAGEVEDDALWAACACACALAGG